VRGGHRRRLRRCGGRWLRFGLRLREQGGLRGVFLAAAFGLRAHHLTFELPELQRQGFELLHQEGVLFAQQPGLFVQETRPLGAEPDVLAQEPGPLREERDLLAQDPVLDDEGLDVHLFPVSPAPRVV
jgi:hypothetical protein